MKKNRAQQPKTPAPQLATIQGQPSWQLKSDRVELCLTKLGGHLGPVTFRVNGRRIQPYSIAPWATERDAGKLVPILRVLRGDFFCMPFGANATPLQGQKFPLHGETANGQWKLESIKHDSGRAMLHARLRTRVRKGTVDKFLFLQEGQSVVYCQSVVSGMSGPMNFGQHAMLKFPEDEGAGLVATSPFIYGQVHPTVFENPAAKGYSSLKMGAEFNDLSKVPMANGGTADLTRYPARRGFEDLVLMASDPDLPFGWTAVTFPKERYVWFALKDPRVLRQTLFWISNGGRHYFPWNGRHTGVMGLEDVTGYFAYGIAESVRPNPLSRQGIPTSVRLDPRKPLVVPYIMGVAPVPAGFDHVREILSAGDQHGISLVSRSGKRAHAAVDLDFLNAAPGRAS